MIIRPMVMGDVDAVMAIAAALPHAPQWPRAAYEAAVDPHARPERLALVALHEQEQIAGFIVVACVAGEADLESIAVAPQAQRSGVATRLLEAAIDALRTRQIHALQLEVRASNSPARALYATAGFVLAGRRPAYYAHPVEDAILLRLEL